MTLTYVSGETSRASHSKMASDSSDEAGHDEVAHEHAAPGEAVRARSAAVPS